MEYSWDKEIQVCLNKVSGGHNYDHALKGDTFLYRLI